MEVTHEMYDEFLDEIYGEIKIGYLTFNASDIVKELDPIAYRVGFSDYEDMMSEEQREGAPPLLVLTIILYFIILIRVSYISTKYSDFAKSKNKKFFRKSSNLNLQIFSDLPGYQFYSPKTPHNNTSQNNTS